MAWLPCAVVVSVFRRAVSPLIVAAVAGLVAVGGCGGAGGEPRDGLGVNEARFSYGDRSAVVALTACGREDDVVVLAGAENGIVLQAEADLGDRGSDRTGVTADLGGDGIVGAFGAAMEHGPAGEITDVRVEGDRLVIEGAWVRFDERLTPQPAVDGQEIDGTLVARCPESGDETARAARTDR